MKRRFVLLLLLCLSALTAAAESRGAQGARTPPITLSVDASEVARKIFHVRETIPAAPGPLTLLYPKWIPGEHGPTGPITDLVGLQFTAGGKALEWRRDPVDMYAFHVEVPPGANSLEVALDFLSATSAVGFTSAASATPHLAIVTWNQLLLYPQGAGTDDITYSASLRLPAGWQSGTSLPVARRAANNNETSYGPVSLTTLVDSPVLAGEYFRVVPLNNERPSVELDIAADSAAALDITPELTNDMRRLVAEAKALFGAQHFENYHFLLTLSDHVAHFGLEHHQSNDSRVAERSLIEKDLSELNLSVLPHEYVHSWNGKFRRPAGLATPDFQQPMQGEMLWVYEGLTQYLGNLLAARSGLWTPEQYRNTLAQVAADLDHRPGRAWRPLIDTTVAAQLLYNAPAQWEAYRRGVDFYDEGWLIWLDADTLIRQQTNGSRSLDDFCRLFHGAPSTAPTVKPYTFDDVVNTLNQVAPYDWRTFLTTRLYARGPRAPLGGVERGGWRLTYNDQPNRYLDLLEDYRKFTEAGYSLGLRLLEDGTVQDTVEGMPAAQAGIGPGMKLVAVNGRKWSPDVLRDALRASRSGDATLDLLVENNEFYKTFPLRYHEGLRLPHLERDAAKDDILTRIITPLTPTAAR